MPSPGTNRPAETRRRTILGRLAAVVVLAVAVLSVGATVSAAPATGTGTAAAPRTFVTRTGHQLMVGSVRFRFAGADEYYLGLDDNVRDAAGNPTYPTHQEVDSALASAVSTGATVIRAHTLGISVGCARCFEPTLGHFDDAALASADYAMYRAGQLGLRLMIPLTDQWRFYHGGESVFAGWAGYPVSPDLSQTAADDPAERAAEAHFYTDPRIVGAFETYVSHLLNHVNRYTGIAYKNDPTVMAWETGNELWTATPAWTETIAGYVKHTLKAKQLVADGSAASGNTVAHAALGAADVDIVGGHFYPVDTAWMVNDAAIAAAHGKAYVVGEFDWTNASATAALIRAVQGDGNIAGDLYWTLMPRTSSGVAEPHGDGFAMYYPAAQSSSAAILSALAGHARWMSTHH